MNFDEIIAEVEQLPISDKWRLVKKLLNILEQQQITIEPDWHQFVQEMYGSINDPNFRRWEQGEYEEREPLE